MLQTAEKAAYVITHRNTHAVLRGFLRFKLSRWKLT